MTTTMNSETVTVGQKLFCNGFPGTVTEVHIGQLSGMASVRLASGSVCVSISELIRFKSADSRKML